MCSCESIDKQDRTVCVQGLKGVKALSLSQKQITLDSVTYATGFSHYILNGEFNMGDSTIPYSIYFSNNPLVSADQLVSHRFPLLEEQEDDRFNCDVKITEDQCLITWSNKKERLFIRNEISEAH